MAVVIAYRRCYATHAGMQFLVVHRIPQSAYARQIDLQIVDGRHRVRRVTLEWLVSENPQKI